MSVTRPDCETCRWQGLEICWSPDLQGKPVPCAQVEWCGVHEPTYMETLAGLLEARKHREGES